MAWQTPRRNQDGVKTELKFRMLGMRHQPPLRGVDDAVVKYARSLAVEAQEDAWTHVQRDA